MKIGLVLDRFDPDQTKAIPSTWSTPRATGRALSSPSVLLLRSMTSRPTSGMISASAGGATPFSRGSVRALADDWRATASLRFDRRVAARYSFRRRTRHRRRPRDGDPEHRADGALRGASWHDDRRRRRSPAGRLARVQSLNSCDALFPTGRCSAGSSTRSGGSSSSISGRGRHHRHLCFGVEGSGTLTAGRVTSVYR